MSQADIAGASDSMAAEAASAAVQSAAIGTPGGYVPASSTPSGPSAGDAAIAKEDSLLTREDGGPAEQSGKPESDKTLEDKPGKDADPAGMVPDKPEDYAITFAEGTTVDDGLLNSFKGKAHELGIPQGKAQELASFYAKHMEGSGQAAKEAQTAQLLNAKNGWESEITGRPEYKQEVMDARRTLKEFGSQEFNDLLDQSLLGSHPLMFDFMAKVGKALAEPEARGRGMAVGSAVPLRDRLWPDK